MARLSRAERASATTTRYVGCFVAPTRVSRIRTAMGSSVPPVAAADLAPAGVARGCDGGAPPGPRRNGLVDGDPTCAAVHGAILADRLDQGVERGQIGLDVLDIAGPFVGRRLGLDEGLDEPADRGDVDEPGGDVVAADAAEERLEAGVVRQRMARSGVEDRGDEVPAVAEHEDVLVDGPGDLGLVARRQAARRRVHPWNLGQVEDRDLRPVVVLVAQGEPRAA